MIRTNQFPELIEEYLLFNSIVRKKSKKLSKLIFREEILSSATFQPIFILSTGRTGTMLFTRIFNDATNTKAFHNYPPEFIEQSKVAYEVLKNNEEPILFRLLENIFLLGREKLLYLCYLHKKIFIETNNRITFLAPVIKTLIPNAKFIHIYRHPGEIIRSGMRRNWYHSDSSHELGRIQPLQSSEYYKAWNKRSQIEKIAWMWNETNEFIETFLAEVANDHKLKIDFNQLQNLDVNRLSVFTGAKLKVSKIKKELSKPVNVQKSGEFPHYENLENEEKEKIKQICGSLASKYGYHL